MQGPRAHATDPLDDKFILDDERLVISSAWFFWKFPSWQACAIDMTAARVPIICTYASALQVAPLVWFITAF